jgi:hypothetical protein
VSHRAGAGGLQPRVLGQGPERDVEHVAVLAQPLLQVEPAVDRLPRQGRLGRRGLVSRPGFGRGLQGAVVVGLLLPGPADGAGRRRVGHEGAAAPAGRAGWRQFERRYREEMRALYRADPQLWNDPVEQSAFDVGDVVLVCGESGPERPEAGEALARCHRRVLRELLIAVAADRGLVVDPDTDALDRTLLEARRREVLTAEGLPLTCSRLPSPGGHRPGHPGARRARVLLRGLRGDRRGTVVGAAVVGGERAAVAGALPRLLAHYGAGPLKPPPPLGAAPTRCRARSRPASGRERPGAVFEACPTASPHP